MLFGVVCCLLLFVVVACCRCFIYYCEPERYIWIHFVETPNANDEKGHNTSVKVLLFLSSIYVIEKL